MTTLRYAGIVDSIQKCAWTAGHVTLTLRAETGATLRVDVPAGELRGVSIGDAFCATFAVVLDQPAIGERS